MPTPIYKQPPFLSNLLIWQQGYKYGTKCTEEKIEASFLTPIHIQKQLLPSIHRHLFIRNGLPLNGGGFGAGGPRGGRAGSHPDQPPPSMRPVPPMGPPTDPIAGGGAGHKGPLPGALPQPLGRRRRGRSWRSPLLSAQAPSHAQAPRGVLKPLTCHICPFFFRFFPGWLGGGRELAGPIPEM